MEDAVDDTLPDGPEGLGFDVGEDVEFGPLEDLESDVAVVVL